MRKFSCPLVLLQFKLESCGWMKRSRMDVHMLTGWMGLESLSHQPSSPFSFKPTVHVPRHPLHVLWTFQFTRPLLQSYSVLVSRVLDEKAQLPVGIITVLKLKLCG